MKTLYIDAGMGAAGDMLTAALLELQDDPAEALRELNALKIPAVRFQAEPSVKCGITGTHMHIYVNGGEEDEFLHDHAAFHAHEHEHHHHDDAEVHEHHHHDAEVHEHEHHHHDGEEAHEHEHTHHHSGMHEISHLIEHMEVPDSVRQDVREVYRLIAEAESRVHGVPVSDIHFHEVGTMDAVADVTAVCYLLHRLSPDRILCSPVHVGAGTVHCAHGVLPVPAPATALILKGIPIYGGQIQSELCTPTGAALLRHFADGFADLPAMTLQKVGYGMGRKDFPRANCVRMLLGEEFSQDGTEDAILELTCNLDDMTAEDMGFAMERLYEGGAKEVFYTPVTTKKNRPAMLLTVLSDPSDREQMLRILFRHTTTIGVREAVRVRAVLRRTAYERDSEFGTVHVKRSEGYGAVTEKIEYDDLSEIARKTGLSLREIRKRLAD